MAQLSAYTRRDCSVSVPEPFTQSTCNYFFRRLFDGDDHVAAMSDQAAEKAGIQPQISETKFDDSIEKQSL